MHNRCPTKNIHKKIILRKTPAEHDIAQDTESKIGELQGDCVWSCFEARDERMPYDMTGRDGLSEPLER